MKLSENEKFAIANALRVAGKQYATDASDARRQAGNCDPGQSRNSWERVAKQFDKQQQECDVLLSTKFIDQL